jgi:hypothetical protein
MTIKANENCQCFEYLYRELCMCPAIFYGCCKKFSAYVFIIFERGAFLYFELFYL